jgi:hypothetical protein
MILSLINPKTDNYKLLKNIILSDEFGWYYHDVSTLYGDEDYLESEKYSNLSFYGHTFLDRPDGPAKYGKKTSSIKSQYFDLVHEVFEEILKYNDFHSDYFYLRMNANCIHSNLGPQCSIPHVDHRFPHKNIIVYLTSSGGSTVVNNYEYIPKEDDAILFGKNAHYLKRPLRDRRIILVATIFADFTE